MLEETLTFETERAEFEARFTRALSLLYATLNDHIVAAIRPVARCLTPSGRANDSALPAL